MRQRSGRGILEVLWISESLGSAVSRFLYAHRLQFDDGSSTRPFDTFWNFNEADSTLFKCASRFYNTQKWHRRIEHSTKERTMRAILLQAASLLMFHRWQLGKAGVHLVCV